MQLHVRDWRDHEVEAWIRVRRTVPPAIDENDLRAIAAGHRMPTLLRAVVTVEDDPVG